MTKINIITAPDIIHGDCLNVLLINPSDDFLNAVQQEILPKVNQGLNIYYHEKERDDRSSISWLLNVSALADVIVIDVDRCQNQTRELLSYLIAKPKTYWLTNREDSVYNLISSNRIYNVSALANMLIQEDPEQE